MRRIVVCWSLFMAVLSSIQAQPIKKPQPLPRDTYYHSGYYLGVNLGQATTSVNDTTAIKQDHSGFAARVYFGYNVNHYVAFEIGYLQFPTIKYERNGLSQAKLASKGYNANLTGKYPLGEGFALYAKLGAAILKSQQTVNAAKQVENATVLAYGGGLDYVFANMGGLHMTLDYYHTEKKNAKVFNVPAENMASLGLYYQF